MLQFCTRCYVSNHHLRLSLKDYVRKAEGFPSIPTEVLSATPFGACAAQFSTRSRTIGVNPPSSSTCGTAAAGPGRHRQASGSREAPYSFVLVLQKLLEVCCAVSTPACATRARLRA